MVRVLDLVDTVVEKGRAQTLKVERAAAVTRRLPGLLFGGTLAIAGIVMLVLAFLLGLVEVTGAIFSEPKPWVAWTVLGGILLAAALFVGTIRNRGSAAPRKA